MNSSSSSSHPFSPEKQSLSLRADLIGQMCLCVRLTVSVSAHQYKLLQSIPDSAPLPHSLSGDPGSPDQYQPRPPAAAETCRHPLWAPWQQLRLWSRLKCPNHYTGLTVTFIKVTTVSTRRWRRANAETATAGPEPEPGPELHRWEAAHKLSLSYFYLAGQRMKMFRSSQLHYFIHKQTFKF